MFHKNNGLCWLIYSFGFFDIKKAQNRAFLKLIFDPRDISTDS